MPASSRYALEYTTNIAEPGASLLKFHALLIIS